MSILWIKSLHLFFMIAWMAGIFYLPRLFVYHAQTKSQEVHEQFIVMERRLWFFITPFALLTLVFGIWTVALYGGAWFKASGWMHTKLLLVSLFYIYHGYLYILMRKFAANKNTHSAKFYRFLNEAPVLALLAIVILAIVKPY